MGHIIWVTLYGSYYMKYANNGVLIDFIGGICQEGKYT